MLDAHFVGEIAVPRSKKDRKQPPKSYHSKGPSPCVLLFPPASRSKELKTTHISKLDLSQLSKSTDNLATDLVGNVELCQGHVRRAEQGIFVGTHDEERPMANLGVLCSKYSADALAQSRRLGPGVRG